MAGGTSSGLGSTVSGGFSSPGFGSPGFGSMPGSWATSSPFFGLSASGLAAPSSAPSSAVGPSSAAPSAAAPSSTTSAMGAFGALTARFRNGTTTSIQPAMIATEMAKNTIRRRRSMTIWSVYIGAVVTAQENHGVLKLSAISRQHSAGKYEISSIYAEYKPRELDAHPEAPRLGPAGC